jgi:hypothetical protein
MSQSIRQSISQLPSYPIARFSSFSSTALLGLALAVIVAVLAASLPARTFYVGDPGVKLIAARTALNQPSRPLEIPLPRIAGEPVPYVDPFFALHGDHTHAVTPELFPLLSAPLLALFGLRGLYVLPGLGFLLALGACAWLGVTLDRRRNPALVLATGFLATPWLFYGLEFWEHALATGVASTAAALFAASWSIEGSALPLSLNGGTGTFASGVLFGVAALLRPEALCFFLAVLVSVRLLPSAPRADALLWALAGCGIALLPLAAYAWVHFGTLLTPHLAGNPALWGDGWLERRALVSSPWFLSLGPTSLWRAAPALPLALIPLSRGSTREGRSFLATVAALTTALIVLTAPNEGGGQWGPRFLLLSFVPLSILLADVVQMLMRYRPVGLLVAALILGVGAWTQRTAYRELRGTKHTYGRLVDFVEQQTQPGEAALTDVWWLDQVAASLTDSRTILVAGSGDAAVEALHRLDRAGTPTTTLFRSRDESVAPPDFWLAGTCFVETGRAEIPERNLESIRLQRCAP